MKPITYGAGEDISRVPLDILGVDETFTDWASLGMHIHGTDPHVFCLWNGHQFETINGTYNIEDGGLTITWAWEPGISQPHEYASLIHFPIDPRITEQDVVNATIAYPNADNDGWLFAHCDADYMRDRESQLVATMADAFAPAHRQLQQKLNGLLVHNIVQREQDAALAKIDLLEQFHVTAEMWLRQWARSLHIGYYHQFPHAAHINEPIETAIRTAASEWSADTDKATKLQNIAATVANVLARATARHDYETRWDMAKRIAAEKRALAAAGTDPVDGYEFCYTSVISNTPITGDANLPDPNWSFDQLRTGAIDRGDYRYTDSETPANAFLYLAIRFKRPIPAGTQAGADIGTVPWEQEPAYLAKRAS